VLLIWIYYSAMIVFFGAEFTQVVARASGTLDTGGATKKTQTPPTSAEPPSRVSHA
jgi:uncharacterized BrkB/YihY/UPF0761 family membrane protein